MVEKSHEKALTLVVGGLVLKTSSMAVAANSISGSTDFRVNIPEVLVLYHWDDAYLTLRTCSQSFQ